MTGMVQANVNGARVGYLDPDYEAGKDRIFGLFQQLGLKTTRPRQLIAERLAELGAKGSEFTTQDLWRDVKAADPTIGRATVFRTVDLLEREGLVDRVSRANGGHRFRLCGASHHHHITCTRCQRVVEVEACLPPDLVASVASSTDFAIDGHALELFGRCGECR
jgi:Fur family transcriptional regulator, ferric uptake regulator